MPTAQSMKLSENIGQTILITSYKPIKGKYGCQYLCTTGENETLFSNKQIKTFIESHEEKPFYILPLENKSFQDKEGKQISYTVVECAN